jgi:cyclase
MTRGRILGAIVGVAAAAIVAHAQGQGAKPQQPLEIEKVTGNLHVITGNGGNVAVYVANDGVVLVDTKLANNGQQILDRVKSVTDKPITHIINTHTHGDHVGSNSFFPATVEIVAHENTAANMAKMKNFAEAATKHGLPDRTFSDRHTVLSGTDAIDLYYFGRAHTSGDAFVVFRSMGVLHAGDVFPGPQVPFMDGTNGGSGVSYPDTLSKAASGIKGIKTVIPGHSAVTNWQAFVDYGEFVREFVSSVQASAKAGKTVDEALADFTPAEKFKSYNMGRAKANVELIYAEIKK